MAEGNVCPFFSKSPTLVQLAGCCLVISPALWCDGAQVSSEGQAGPLKSFSPISFPFEEQKLSGLSVYILVGGR